MPTSRRELAFLAIMDLLTASGFWTTVQRRGVEEPLEEDAGYPFAIVIDGGERATDGELGGIDPDVDLGITLIVRSDSLEAVDTDLNQAMADVTVALRQWVNAEPAGIISNLSYVGAGPADIAPQAPRVGGVTVSYSMRYTRSESDPYSA
jgi:hypothetical protein